MSVCMRWPLIVAFGQNSMPTLGAHNAFKKIKGTQVFVNLDLCQGP